MLGRKQRGEVLGGWYDTRHRNLVDEGDDGVKY